MLHIGHVFDISTGFNPIWILFYQFLILCITSVFALAYWIKIKLYY